MKDKKTIWETCKNFSETSWESKATKCSPRSEENDEPWWYDEK